MNQIKAAIANMGAHFRVIDWPSCHPDGLTHLNEDEFHAHIEFIHHTKVEQRLELVSPSDRLTGSGGIAYAGYDTEFVKKGGRLHALSYQFYLIGEMGELGAVYFPKSGSEEDRLGLSDMLPPLIEKAIETGCLLDYPSQVIMIGFFLRADLAMLSDLVEYKTELGNVGGKIATTKRPVEFELLYSRKDVESLTANAVVHCG